MCNIECTTANAVTDSVVGQSLELMYAHRDAQLRSTQRRQWGVKQPRLDISLRVRGRYRLGQSIVRLSLTDRSPIRNDLPF